MDKDTEKNIKKTSQNLNKVSEESSKASKSLSSLSKQMEEQKRKEESYARLRKYGLISEEKSPKTTQTFSNSLSRENVDVFFVKITDILTQQREAFFSQFSGLVPAVSSQGISRGEQVEEERQFDQRQDEILKSQESFSSKISQSFEKITDSIANNKNKVSFISKILLGLLFLAALIRAAIINPEATKKIALTILNAVWSGIKFVGKAISSAFIFLANKVGKWFDDSIIGSIISSFAYIGASLNILRYTKVINETSKLGKFLIFISQTINRIFGIFGKIPLMLTGTGLVTGWSNFILFLTDDLPRFFKMISNGVSAVTGKIAFIYNKLFGWSKIAVSIGNRIGKMARFFGGIFTSIFAKVTSFFGFFTKIGTGVAKVGSIFPKIFAFVGKIFGFAVKILRFGRLLQSLPVIGQILTLLFVTIDAIRGFFKGFLGEGGSILKGIRGAIAQIISGLTFGLLDFDVIDEFLAPIFDVISSIVVIWKDLFVNNMKAIWKILSGLFGVIWDSLKVTWTIITGSVKVVFAMLSGLFSIMMAPFKAIWEFFGSIWDVVTDSNKTIWEKMWGFLEALLMLPVNILKHVWNAISGIGSVIWDVVKDIFGSMYNFGSSLIDYILGLPSILWEWIKGIVSSLFGAGSGGFLEQLIKNGIDWIKNSVMSVIKSVGNLGSMIIDSFMGLVKGMMKKILDYVPSWLIPDSLENWVYGKGEPEKGEKNQTREEAVSKPVEKRANVNKAASEPVEKRANVNKAASEPVEDEREAFKRRRRERIIKSVESKIEKARRDGTLITGQDGTLIARQDGTLVTMRLNEETARMRKNQTGSNNPVIIQNSNSNVNNTSAAGGDKIVYRPTAAIDPSLPRLRNRHHI